VGEQAAIAIDNARMIKALEEQEARLEDQNDMLGLRTKNWKTSDSSFSYRTCNYWKRRG
jgi:two-component system sensor histidine kinase BarA